MQQAVPDKELLKHQPRVRAQPAAAARIVRGCHEWPSGHRRGIRTGRKQSRVHVEERLRERALVPLNRMLDLRLHYVDNE